MKAKLPNGGFYGSLCFRRVILSFNVLKHAHSFVEIQNLQQQFVCLFVFHGADSMNSNSEDNSVRL